ncbi:hypothetical protein GCM10022393_26280 [Aquimarina addita]|uniref:Lipoprotein n=1 Tax=Aquimarina addita TaxID=870485 RepID=A0ABP6UPZ0_9FLAO
MKRLFVPLALISFSVACLGFIHIDNMRKIKEAPYSKLKKMDKQEFTDLLSTR